MGILVKSEKLFDFSFPTLTKMARLHLAIKNVAGCKTFYQLKFQGLNYVDG